jgi:cysteinyl-tRNA synthetase
VRYWCHYGFVNVDAQKMSKSLGNFFTIRDARSRYSAPALRFFLLGTHYRSPLNFSHEALENAADRLFYVYSTLADVEEELEALKGKAEAEAEAAASSSSPDAPPPPSSKKDKAPPVSTSKELAEADADLNIGKGPGGEALAGALGSLADDVGTPGAVAALSAPLKQANDLLKTKAGKKAPRRAYALASISAGIQAVLELLGLEPRPDAKASLEELKDAALLRCGVSREDVARGIEERAAARAAKDWAAADAVRERFERKGIAISDTVGGETTWRPVARAVGGGEE